MKTLVVEPMPELFWQIVDEKGWRDHFVNEISSNIEILIIRTKTQATKTFIARFPKLKAIIRAGTGFDNIDVHEAVKRNIIVCNTPEANAISAAEHTISFILALIKQHQIAKENVLNRNWKANMNNCRELSDLKVLIVGVGRVGTRVARILHNLGADVRGVDPYLSKNEWNDRNVKKKSYSAGIKWCNLLSFHCPLYKDTEHYFNMEVLHQFDNPFWLINTARGKIVQEQAVQQGLDSNKILGYAADVFENEPWQCSAFSSYTNVYLSPHIGAFTYNAKNRLAKETLRVWQDYFFHRKIRNCVDLKFCY